MQARESFYRLSELNTVLEKVATRSELQALSARVDDRFEQVDKRFEQVDKRFVQVEARLDRVETRMDQMTATLATLEDRSRHGATRSWVLSGAVCALVGLLGWLSRGQLFAGLQSAGL
ncbi:hypothetical protein [Luteibacter yeojuensis]|uniref:hypothetical protein n=1 Tax=Luteibacter yeojuensis TaxID=345309 RepID=UPI000697A795|nr:hypothetical protein [Luteibacter yeojuensis]